VGALALSSLLVACGSDSDDTAAPPAFDARLTAIDKALVIPEAEATTWFQNKAGWGATYTGSPAWKSYMAFIEGKLGEYGAQNITRARFPYERWYTTEYADKSGWSLTSDGTAVDVASYATQSGSTGPNGVTAQMVLYDLSQPAASRPNAAAMAGKIVVVKLAPYTYTGNSAGYTDYEYRSNEDQFLAPFTAVDPTYEASYRNRQQYGQMGGTINSFFRGATGKPVGHVVVMDMPPGAAQGGRQHGTPNRYEVPGLLLDKKNGAKVVEDARAGKSATLKLDAQVEADALAYTLVATLPGKDYGTAKDTAVMMATHVDGPALIQDAGSLGILGVLKYYAAIPQAQRPRSIFVVFDTRHFVPGAERTYPFDFVEDNHDTLSKWVVGGVAMEHVGGAQMADAGDDFRATGRAMTTYINTHGNDINVEKAIEAVKASGLERAQVNAEERPGVNGKEQNNWFGRNFAAHLESLGNHPVWHVTGDWPSSGYQAFYPGMDRFKADVFRAQVATGAQLVATLMTTGDLVPMSSSWSKLNEYLSALADADFADASTAAAQRSALLDQSKVMFAAVRTSDYAKTIAQLDEIKAAVSAAAIDNTRRTAVLEIIEDLRVRTNKAIAAKA
jgi:hypothetical protein